MIFRRMPRRILSIENKLVIIFSDQFEGTTLILLKYVKIVKFWSALIVYVFVLHSLLFLYRGGKIWALCSKCKSDRADFTNGMSFILPKLMEETSPKPPAQIP